MRLPAKNSQSGRWGAEKTPVCPEKKEHGYMNRQSVRVKKGTTTRPTSWICLVCGKMQLDEEKFKKLQEELEQEVNLIG